MPFLPVEGQGLPGTVLGDDEVAHDQEVEARRVERPDGVFGSANDRAQVERRVHNHRRAWQLAELVDERPVAKTIRSARMRLLYVPR